MNKEYVYLLISVAITLVLGVALLRAEHRASFLEGREAVFQSFIEAEDHVCGPYEQPITKRKTTNTSRANGGSTKPD
jgi:hypothetical protein